VIEAAAPDAEWTFAERRAALLADHARHGTDWTRAHTSLVDAWLAELLGDEPDVALVALGSYGREELAPASDLDVVLLHRGRRDVADVANRIWYPIWDAGFTLDHSVKTIEQALDVARRDLKAALGLVDARYVAGDRDLAGELVRRAADDWQRHARRFLDSLSDSIAERHRRAGDVAFLLEPDLKDGRGGLRDVGAVAAAARAVRVIPDEDNNLSEAAAMLIAARVELHRLAGAPSRGGDRLGLQDQEAVAAALDYPDADALMHAIASAARSIGWATDDAWRRVRSWLRGPRGRGGGGDQIVSPGIVLRDDEVVVTHDADLGDDSLILRVGAAAARSGAPIGRASLERLQDKAPAPGETWSSGARDALVELLLLGAPAIPACEALDQYDLMTRVLPEWEAVRSKLQHNPYHRYTVDRHLLEAAAQAATLAPRVQRPDLLVVAAWLHDLGKGFPGDHTDVGVELMTRIGTRLGYDDADRDVLVQLVRHHLLLADAATRRDIRDPETVVRVAAEVHDALTLELLHALTEADSKATGESAWSAWKEGLVGELVAAVEIVLSGAAPAARDTEPPPEVVALAEEARGALLVRADVDAVTIVAPDRPGLFCKVAGVLALHGLDVLAADAWSAPRGMVVDEFRVQRTLDAEPDWSKLERDLDKALHGALALDARLAERARRYAARRRVRSRKAPTSAVTVDNDASSHASVVEVRGPDAIGMLYRITKAFFELQLDIRHAKVLTLGLEVVDSFYAVDGQGDKLDGERSDELRRAVLYELSRD
jgi:[protein-PII] uridylyltransferase